MVLMKGGSFDGCRTTWWVSTRLVCGIEEGESRVGVREWRNCKIFTHFLSVKHFIYFCLGFNS